MQDRLFVVFICLHNMAYYIIFILNIDCVKFAHSIFVLNIDCVISIYTKIFVIMYLYKST
jgi:hypothetical protein